MTDPSDTINRRSLLTGAVALLGGLGGIRWQITDQTNLTQRIKPEDIAQRVQPVTGDGVAAEPRALSQPDRQGTAEDTANCREYKHTADRLGVTHVAGSYSFTNQDFLNEGAAVAESLGTNVIKVWLQSMEQKYPQGADWPGVDEPVEIARTRHVRELFNRPFDTFVLVTASAVGDHNFYFRDGFSAQQRRQEVAAFRDLTQHLLREYRGSNKKFILQHWEGDWGILGSYDLSETASPEQFEAMTRWLNARQEGIRQARQRINSDVTVLGATEVNLVVDAMSGTPRLITEVVPDSDCDLVSLSAWQPVASLLNRQDSRAIAEGFQRVLSFVNKHAPEVNEYTSAQLCNNKNVYIGELGWPLNQSGSGEAMRIIRTTTQVALKFGAPYILYWQVFDNETLDGVFGEPTNTQVPGNHLIRPDGTKAPTWHYLSEQINTASKANSTRSRDSTETSF